MKWTKRDLEGIRSAISGGALVATGGLLTDAAIDARARLEADRGIAYRLAVHELHFRAKLWEGYARGSEDLAARRDTTDAELQTRREGYARENRAKARRFQRLHDKLLEAGDLPPEIVTG